MQHVERILRAADAMRLAQAAGRTDVVDAIQRDRARGAFNRDGGGELTETVAVLAAIPDERINSALGIGNTFCAPALVELAAHDPDAALAEAAVQLGIKEQP